MRMFPTVQMLEYLDLCEWGGAAWGGSEGIALLEEASHCGMTLGV